MVLSVECGELVLERGKKNLGLSGRKRRGSCGSKGGGTSAGSEGGKEGKAWFWGDRDEGGWVLVLGNEGGEGGCGSERTEEQKEGGGAGTLQAPRSTGSEMRVIIPRNAFVRPLNSFAFPIFVYTSRWIHFLIFYTSMALTPFLYCLYNLSAYTVYVQYSSNVFSTFVPQVQTV